MVFLLWILGEGFNMRKCCLIALLSMSAVVGVGLGLLILKSDLSTTASGATLSTDCPVVRVLI